MDVWMVPSHDEVCRGTGARFSTCSSSRRLAQRWKSKITRHV